MADFSITLTVPDGKVNELVAAMNWAWGYTGDGQPGNSPAPKTAAQLRAEFKQRSAQSLKDLHTRYQQHLREQAALASPPDIT